MIARLPRVVYKPLVGEDWSITEIDGERLIIVNSALDEEERKRARKAALAAARQGHGAWLPVPVILGINWAERQARGPLGSAVIASGMTFGLLYGVGAIPEERVPVAEPPTVVTVHVTPTSATSSPPTPSARATTRRRTPPASAAQHPAPGPGTSAPRHATPPPASPPRRHTPTKAPSPTPDDTDTPPPSSSQAQPAPSGRPADTATPPPTTPPAATAEAAPPASAVPSGSVAEAADDPAAQEECQGIHLDVDVNPVLDVDACLLG